MLPRMGSARAARAAGWRRERSDRAAAPQGRAAAARGYQLSHIRPVTSNGCLAMVRMSTASLYCSIAA